MSLRLPLIALAIALAVPSLQAKTETTTVKIVSPCPMLSTQSALRNALRPCATAS